MKHRAIRLRIAFALAGQGSAKAFAKEYNSSHQCINRVAKGNIETNGRAPKSFRLERAIDLFIAEQFKKYPEILNLDF